jgi:hypothetical protein
VRGSSRPWSSSFALQHHLALVALPTADSAEAAQIPQRLLKFNERSTKFQRSLKLVE